MCVSSLERSLVRSVVFSVSTSAEIKACDCILQWSLTVQRQNRSITGRWSHSNYKRNQPNMGAKKRVTLSLIWVTNVLFELETEPTKKRLQYVPWRFKSCFPEKWIYTTCMMSIFQLSVKSKNVDSRMDPNSQRLLWWYGMLRVNMIPVNSLLVERNVMYWCWHVVCL